MRLQQVTLFFTLICLLVSCKQTNEQLLQKANALSKENKHDKAIEIYSEVIKRNNKLQVAWYNRGLAYLETKKYDQALADLNKLVALIPHEGFAAIISSDSPYADEETRGQVAYNDALFQLAQVKYYVDSLESSFSDFQFLIGSNYKKGSCLLWQGAIYVKRGETDSACAVFKNAKQFAATNVERQQSNEMTNVYCGQ